jgi:hypothetical protein
VRPAMKPEIIARLVRGFDTLDVAEGLRSEEMRAAWTAELAALREFAADHGAHRLFSALALRNVAREFARMPATEQVARLALLVAEAVATLPVSDGC